MTVQAAAPRAEVAGKTAKGWIFNPAVDLIVGCGAWSAPLIALVYFLGSSQMFAWGTAFYLLALAFNYPHYMATIYRAYHTREDFAKYRVFTIYLTVLLLLTGLASHLSPRLLPWIFTLYVNWSPWHYTGQNYGLLMMFARRQGAQITVVERRYLHWAFVASFLMLLLSFHSGISNDPLVLSLNLPARITTPLIGLLGAMFLTFGVAGLRRLVKQIGPLAAVEPIALFITQFLWFVLPSAIAILTQVDTPQTRYSTGVLALMHAAQYIWITSYYAKKEATEKAQPWKFASYYAVLVIGGIALFVPGPWLASYLFHFDFTSSFLIFTALVNIHHFMLDGAIWKLRDGRIAALLLNVRTEASEQAENAAGMASKAARWAFGPAALPRMLRWTVAIILLMWASVDQLKFMLTADRSNIESLMRAHGLNPHDSVVSDAMAAWLEHNGEIDLAITARKQALATNPEDAIARSSLIDMLVKNSRYLEAYQVARHLPLAMQRDPDVWTNTGMLAMQVNQFGDATVDFREALRLNPEREETHILLGEALQQNGDPRQAIVEYETYMAFVAAHKNEWHPTPGTLIPAVVRLGSALQEIGSNDRARLQYDLAISLAHQSSQPSLESFAYISKAQLEEKIGKKSEAAHAYQHAISIDESLQDSLQTEGMDWFTYGKFLQEQKYPLRLAYACYLKSKEVFTKAHAKTELDTINKFASQTEAQLGKEAEDIKKDPTPVLAEAMAVE